MAAARHTSAQAQLTYQDKSKKSESNKIAALLDAAKEKEVLSPLDMNLDEECKSSDNESVPIGHMTKLGRKYKKMERKLNVLRSRYEHAAKTFDMSIEKERLDRDSLDDSYESEMERLRFDNTMLKRKCTELSAEVSRLKRGFRVETEPRRRLVIGSVQRQSSNLNFTQELTQPEATCANFSTPVAPTKSYGYRYTQSTVKFFYR